MISTRTRMPDGKIAQFNCDTLDYKTALNMVLEEMCKEPGFNSETTPILALIPDCGRNFKVKIAHRVHADPLAGAMKVVAPERVKADDELPEQRPD